MKEETNIISLNQIKKGKELPIVPSLLNFDNFNDIRLTKLSPLLKESYKLRSLFLKEEMTRKKQAEFNKRYNEFLINIYKILEKDKFKLLLMDFIFNEENIDSVHTMLKMYCMALIDDKKN